MGALEEDGAEACPAVAISIVDQDTDNVIVPWGLGETSRPKRPLFCSFSLP